MIRMAEENNLSKIVDIYNQAILQKNATADLTPKTVKDQQAWFAAHNENYPIFVFEKNKKIVGWCSLSAYRNGREAVAETAEISYYVDAAHRHQGVASQLIQHVLDACPIINKRVLFAIIIADNYPSIRLLEKFGFEHWGFLPQVVKIDGILKGHVYMGRQV